MAAEAYVERLLRDWMTAWQVTDPGQVSAAERFIRAQVTDPEAEWWSANGPLPRQLTINTIRQLGPRGTASAERQAAVQRQEGVREAVRGVVERAGGLVPEQLRPTGERGREMRPYEPATAPATPFETIMGGRTGLQPAAAPGPGPSAGPAAGAPMGERLFPIVGYTPQGRNDIAKHWDTQTGGADLYAPKGTPIRAMMGGTIKQVSAGGPGGNNLTIRGDDGLEYYYAHLNDFGPGLQRGGRVETGQHLGGVGDTGNAAGKGDHLHLGIGTRILDGTGAEGGTGVDADGKPFDATSVLNRLYSGMRAELAGEEVVRTGRAFNPNTMRAQSFDEAAGFITDVVRNAGYPDEVAKIAIAIAAQEQGWGGKTGDGGKSAGTFHLFTDGKLKAWADANRRSVPEALAYLQQFPQADVDWAIRNYIGPLAEASLRETGDIGAALRAVITTPGQGQNPNADPSAYVGQLVRLFGSGQPLPTLEGTATAAGVTPGRFRGSPPLPPGGFTDVNQIRPYIDEVLQWQDITLAELPPDDPDYARLRDVINKEAQDKIRIAWDFEKIANERGVEAARQKIAEAQLGIQREELGIARSRLGLEEEQQRFTRERAGRADWEWEQAWARQERRDAEEDAFRKGQLYGWGLGPAGELIPTMAREQFEEEKTQFQQTRQDQMLERAANWELQFQRDMMSMAEREAELREAAAAREMQLLPWAFTPGQEYARGYEPGGVAAKLYEMAGLPFQPIGRDQTFTVYPYAGVGEYQQRVAPLQQRPNPFARWLVQEE